ncbi:hypothetical protein PF008_g24928 [Phytophthora fragariae]|uniref:Cytochrome P450 n=1 Tax=Phytophthora fragariae TaxID=53985 RepID=A0A6G0QM98_9STRA|nr:hypothetical protein PF008_g24928 [Phytophthora fragariae]
MNFLLAGSETTSFSLSWVIVNLNRYPDVLAKLRAEFREKLPGLMTGEIDAPTTCGVKMKHVSSFKFVSFIAGPRQCIGMRFALLQMRIAIAVLFSRFDLKTVEDPFEITYDIAFTLPVEGPLNVSVRDRAPQCEIA